MKTIIIDNLKPFEATLIKECINSYLPKFNQYQIEQQSNGLAKITFERPKYIRSDSNEISDANLFCKGVLAAAENFKKRLSL